jgi:hypothetical protein
MNNKTIDITLTIISAIITLAIITAITITGRD